jgi:hypothetical protein
MITNQEAKWMQKAIKDRFGKKVSFYWNKDSSKIIFEEIENGQ